jgi:ribosome-binding protein aMBF1 (putative translation factor)
VATKNVDAAGRIMAAREALGLSRQALAKRLRTTYLQVYRIETGVIDVSVAHAKRFGKALGLTASEILFGNSERAA